MAIGTANDAHHRKSKLVVFLHGIRPIDRERKATFLEALAADMPNAEILARDLPISSYICTVAAAGIAVTVIGWIDEKWQENIGYEEIILVGHSAGGALARKVFLGAWGQDGRRVPYEKSGDFDKLQTPKEWAPKITRIVMLAGIVAGWQASGRQRWLAFLGLNMAGLLGHFSPIGNLTFFEFRRGAPFIINTRLQWIDFVRNRPGHVVPVIQMLGSIDDIVAPNETLDFTPADLDHAFFVIEVPSSNHLQLLDVNRNLAQGEVLERQEKRRELLTIALLGAVRDAQSTPFPSVRPVKSVALEFLMLGDSRPPPAEPEVKHVVFVIHGIRDDGFWTKKLATHIKLLGAKNNQCWRSITTSYGYFAMLPFIFPWIRRQKVEWLMDIYAQAALRYPEARFHYVGHSNGTYLCAAAMRDYRGCFFERVVFAGSVVDPKYPWPERVGDSGVKAVMNYVATRDWVVALAPNALRHGGKFFDLGGAGHVGFQMSKPPFVTEMRYLIGQHSAGIKEERWDEIARFITETHPAPTTAAAPGYFLEHQPRDIRLLGWLSPGIAAILVMLAAVIFLELLFAAAGSSFLHYLSRGLAKFGDLPLAGGFMTTASSTTEVLSQWWQSWNPVFDLIFLVLYTKLFRFITTRF